MNTKLPCCPGSAQRIQTDVTSEGDRSFERAVITTHQHLSFSVHLCLLTTRISSSSLLTTTLFLVSFVPLLMARNATRSAAEKQSQPQIWWGNAVFFTLVHIGAVIGIYYMPLWSIKRATLLLWFFTWQLSDFGCVKSPHVSCDSPQGCSITIGYHRLYSHKAFRATLGVRITLAILGSSAFQGSIKVGITFLPTMSGI